MYCDSYVIERKVAALEIENGWYFCSTCQVDMYCFIADYATHAGLQISIG